MIHTSGSDMNNFVVRVLVPIIGSVFAAMATIWLMQSVNPLAALCFLLATVIFVVAIVAPRTGLVLLMLLFGYSDFFKRLLVIFGDLNFDQVSYVLIAAPLVVLGLIISLLTQRAFHQITIERSDIAFGVLAAVMTMANFLLAKMDGEDLLSAGKLAVNNGVFVSLAVVGLRCFRGQEDVEKFLRTILLVFVPVAIYGLYQLYYGYADFEVDYLKTGLSIEIKNLYDIRPRPFSTLNSAGALGTVCGGLVMLALYPWLARLSSAKRSLRRGEAVGSLVLALIFLAATFGSLIRAAHIVWLVAGVAFLCFSSRRGTKIFYIAAVSGLFGIIFGAGFIQKNMDFINPAQFAKTDYQASVLDIQTYNERLNGFINLTTTTEFYSLFGLSAEAKRNLTLANHDSISGMFINIGVVGVLIFISGLVYALIQLHGKLLAMPRGSSRVTAALLTATLLGWLIAEVLVRSVITTFPLNGLFWLLAGIIAHLVLQQNPEAPEAAEKPEENPGERLPTLASTPAWARDVSLERPGKPARQLENGGPPRFRR